MLVTKRKITSLSNVELLEVGEYAHYVIEELLTVDMAGKTLLQRDIVKRLSIHCGYSEMDIQMGLNMFNSIYSKEKCYAIIEGKKISKQHFYITLKRAEDKIKERVNNWKDSFKGLSEVRELEFAKDDIYDYKYENGKLKVQPKVCLLIKRNVVK